MPVLLLHRLLTLSLGLLLFALAVSAGVAIIAPLVGEPLLVSWEVVAAPERTIALLQSEAAMVSAALDRGEIEMRATSLLFSLVRLLELLITGSLMLVVLWSLRRVVSGIRAGRPFSNESVRYLRWTGCALIALPVTDLLSSLLWPHVLLPEGLAASSFLSTSITVAGADLRLLPVFDPGAALAGLVVLVIAEAFRAGLALQRDSDEIV